jgi:hypothetical protein
VGGPERPILGTVPGIAMGPGEPDRIARELRRAMGVWRKRRDPSALRLAIELLLAMPEMARTPSATSLVRGGGTAPPRLSTGHS